jgi:hypothetical protein
VSGGGPCLRWFLLHLSNLLGIRGFYKPLSFYPTGKNSPHFFPFSASFMKDKAPTRNGIFADADLAADCDDRANSVESCLDELTGEGMTAQMVKDFRQETEEFRQLPTDENLLKQVTTAVEHRDTALEAARTGLRRASQPVGRAYGTDSSEYHSFAVGEVSRKTVSEVLNLLLTVPGIGMPYLKDPKAIAEGYTADRIKGLDDLYHTLFAQEALVGKAATTAEQGTRVRVLAYNALNTKCSAYCARGYDHFVETDASKAKLFVRNPASKVAAAVVPPVPPVQA